MLSINLLKEHVTVVTWKEKRWTVRCKSLNDHSFKKIFNVQFICSSQLKSFFLAYASRVSRRQFFSLGFPIFRSSWNWPLYTTTRFLWKNFSNRIMLFSLLQLKKVCNGVLLCLFVFHNKTQSFNRNFSYKIETSFQPWKCIIFCSSSQGFLVRVISLWS